MKKAGQSSGQRVSSSISNDVAAKVEVLQAAKAGQSSGQHLSSSISHASTRHLLEHILKRWSCTTNAVLSATPLRSKVFQRGDVTGVP